ncbi:MAG: hypothetical protein U9O41_02720, partial [Candidatus Aerophobetes bacterium]|nr:hypothetical protein [Candidatus Aerophobetes bacterium]
KDIIDKMRALESVSLSNLKISMSDLENKSAALLRIEANNQEQLGKAEDLLEELADEKELLFVKGLE